ncbi:glycerophosphodiester phosphodiesterase family protein [Tissierella creatinophila]|uniref:Glycerophosphoryl diester phosphodiesterase n=1 Tax=Tissierella creatinophila DSM 6911 TaxID=1123403 RepID=A0A1U7M680_TISCR|nr:glycerophosphodiester phosphodiesterase family protein [Tissierella creatinophila]OLS02698.1 glycerophosphoryl diester phosphodiesterase precursor [Tissierella creatinophila DSM 6911]
MEKRVLNEKRILNNSLRMIYDTFIYLVLFEVIYKGVILVIFKPIIEIIVSLFNKDGSYMFLVNEDITRFLLRSTGYLMIVVLMIISIILVYYELSVILLILDSGKKKEKIKLLQITETALLKLKDVIKNKNIGLVLYILILIPIFNIGMQTSLYPIFSFPHWIIKKISKFPGSEILSILLGIGLIYLFTKLFIVLPIMIFSNKSFKEASKISFKTVKNEQFKIAFLMMIVMLIWLILTYPPFMILEILQSMLPLIIRSASNISITIFTLFIAPFILAISLENYNLHVRSGDLDREEVYEKIKLGQFGKKLWSILGKILQIIQDQIFKIRNHIKAFIFVTLVIIIGVNIYSDESIIPIYEKQLLIGHRGGNYGVENTIDTILYAGTNGADYVEIDILLTKDSVPVVIHDNSLKRLADTRKKISNLTVDEVKKVTLEDGKEKDDIPLLEELSRKVKGKTNLLVEFKTHDKEKASVVDKTIEVLEKEGILEETIFQTAEYDIIKDFNEKYKDLSIGYIFKGRIGVFPTKKLSQMPVDFISVKELLINKKMIKELHKSGKAVFTWTTNNDYKAEKLLKLGVDGIITDYSVEMMKPRDKYKDYNEK